MWVTPVPGLSAHAGGAWSVEESRSPLVAVALHAGHSVSPEVAQYLALSDEARLYEEDPYSDRLLPEDASRVVVHLSRFQVDLNRPRDRAIYLRPEDSWGLRVWRTTPSRHAIRMSLMEYDAFYAEADRLLHRIARQHRHFVVLDIHTYNQRRGGPTALADPAARCPEINVGTGSMDRSHFAPIVDTFISAARRHDFMGRKLDVRENVRFRGGWFPAWVHRTFPRSGCALAIEVKKFFMNEWSFQVDPVQLREIRRLLESVCREVTGVLAEWR